MASVNKVIIVGYLGKDPETRYMPSGEAVASFSVATTTSWKDKQTGEKKEETEWHRCTAFNRTGEVAGEYLKKGSLVYIEGRIKTEKWTDKDGNDRYSTKIIVEKLTMLGGKRDDEGQPASKPSAGGSANDYAAASGRSNTAKKPASGNVDEMDDDIPF